MGSGASVGLWSMDAEALANGLVELNDGKYAEFKEVFVNSGLTGIDLTKLLASETGFDTMMASIGIDDKETRTNLFADLSTIHQSSPSRPKMVERESSLNTSAQIKLKALKDKHAEKANQLRELLTVKQEREAQALHQRLAKRKTKKLERLSVKKEKHGLSEQEVAKQEKMIEAEFEAHRIKLNNSSKKSPSGIDFANLVSKKRGASIKLDGNEMSEAEELKELQSSDAHALMFTYMPMISWLISWIKDLGADLNQEDSNGLTTLMATVEGGSSELVQQMIDCGCDVNAVAGDGSSALMTAAQYGHTDAIECLISNGADLNAFNADGWTALHFAVIANNLDAVESLLDAGIDQTIKDQEGYDAMEYAKEAEESDILAALEYANPI